MQSIKENNVLWLQNSNKNSQDHRKWSFQYSKEGHKEPQGILKLQQLPIAHSLFQKPQLDLNIL